MRLWTRADMVRNFWSRVRAQGPTWDPVLLAVIVWDHGGVTDCRRSQAVTVFDMKEQQGGEAGRKDSLIGPSVLDPVFRVEQVGLAVLGQVVLENPFELLRNHSEALLSCFVVNWCPPRYLGLWGHTAGSPSHWVPVALGAECVWESEPPVCPLGSDAQRHATFLHPWDAAAVSGGPRPD